MPGAVSKAPAHPGEQMQPLAHMDEHDDHEATDAK